MFKLLVNKYNIARPRYMSYLTVPYWNTDSFAKKKWKSCLIKSINKSNYKEGVSLHINLPVCKRLLTFCGWKKGISKRGTESPYINAVLKEWYLYLELFDYKPIIKELHLGGGIITFFSPKNLKHLIIEILKTSELAVGYEFSFEGRPNKITHEHLQTLFDVGFRRVSYCLQDYKDNAQNAVQNIQSFKIIKQATDLAKEVGYNSVDHDIIFGLPFSTLEHLQEKFRKTIELIPDQLALRNYAHVPRINGNGQRWFNDKNLFTAKLKRDQDKLGKELISKTA